MEDGIRDLFPAEMHLYVRTVWPSPVKGQLDCLFSCLATAACIIHRNLNIVHKCNKAMERARERYNCESQRSSQHATGSQWNKCSKLLENASVKGLQVECARRTCPFSSWNQTEACHAYVIRSITESFALSGGCDWTDFGPGMSNVPSEFGSLPALGFWYIPCYQLDLTRFFQVSPNLAQTKSEHPRVIYNERPQAPLDMFASA